MQYRAAWMAMQLSKFDHVSQYYPQLIWLPFKKLIQFQSSCLMFCQYHQVKCIPLSSPIQFGCINDLFANSQRLSLAFTQKRIFFRFTAAHWWNAIPSSFFHLAIKGVCYQQFHHDFHAYLLNDLQHLACIHDALIYYLFY